MSETINRFYQKVEKTDSCWNWTACKNIYGYGQFKLNGRMIGAHRISYELAKGQIPDGFTLDHLCRNRICVNPDHLEAVPLKVNVLRGIGICAINKRKTHCFRGHKLNEKNTRYYKNKRWCRICLNEHTKKYRLLNIKRINEYQKKYNQKNKLWINEKQRKYRQENKALVSEQGKRYRQKNKVLINQRNKISGKKYRKKNRTQINEKHRRRYQKNRTRILEKQKRYRQKHKLQIKKYKKRYYQKKIALIKRQMP